MSTAAWGGRFRTATWRPSRLLVALVMTLGIAHAHALECPVMPGADPKLATVDGEGRLEFIDRELRRSAHKARIWSWTWGTIYGGLAVGNFAAAPFVSSSSRGNYLVSGGSAAIGVAALALSPLKVMRDQKRLATSLAGFRAGDDRCALLAEAERYLERDAANQAFGRGPVVMGASVAYTVGVGLGIGFGFHDWQDAGIFIGSGLATSALQIGTQPSALISVLKRYRSGNLESPLRAHLGSGRAIQIVPTFGGAGGTAGLGIVGVF